MMFGMLCINYHKTLLSFCLICFASVQAFSGWNQKAHFPGTARHRCISFTVGNKGYIGGGHANSGGSYNYKDFWQYDPATDSWTQIADFGGGYRYHGVGFGIGNFGYVGLGEGSSDDYFNDFWKYIPLINQWVPIANFPSTPRRGSSVFIVNNQAYVGLGQSDNGYEIDFFRFDPVSASWYNVASFPGAARSSAVAFSYENRGYIVTGHIFGNDSKDFFTYNTLNNTWTQLDDFPGLERQDATGFVIDNNAFLLTGNDVEGDNNFSDFWRYDFQTGIWTELPEFPASGRRFMTSFVIQGIAYCGTGTNGTNLNDFWAYHPLAHIDSETETTISIYPNPFIDEIHIQSEIPVYSALLLNNEGKTISTTLEKNYIHFNSTLPDGNYFLIIELENGTRISQLLIKSTR